MDLFDWLLVGHLIGDFLFQTSWMAQNKAKKWLPLLVHSSVYTGTVSIVAFAGGGLSISAIIIIFIGHVLLDRKTFVAFWVRHVQTANGQEAKWLTIVTDQIFHVVLLVAAIYLT